MVESLNETKLNALLGWRGVPLEPLKRKEEKLAGWKQIVASSKAPPLYARWTQQDEEQLEKLDECGLEGTGVCTEGERT